jgi:hypothetical protein
MLIMVNNILIIIKYDLNDNNEANVFLHYSLQDREMACLNDLTDHDQQNKMLYSMNLITKTIEIVSTKWEVS